MIEEIIVVATTILYIRFAKNRFESSYFMFIQPTKAQKYYDAFCKNYNILHIIFFPPIYDCNKLKDGQSLEPKRFDKIAHPLIKGIPMLIRQVVLPLLLQLQYSCHKFMLGNDLWIILPLKKDKKLHFPFQAQGLCVEKEKIDRNDKYEPWHCQDKIQGNALILMKYVEEHQESLLYLFQSYREYDVTVNHNYVDKKSDQNFVFIPYYLKKHLPKKLTVSPSLPPTHPLILLFNFKHIHIINILWDKLVLKYKAAFQADKAIFRDRHQRKMGLSTKCLFE